MLAGSRSSTTSQVVSPLRSLGSRSKKTIFAARDHTGERTLFITPTQTEFFAFAYHAARPPLCLPGVSTRELNRQHLIDAFVLARVRTGKHFLRCISRPFRRATLCACHARHSITCTPLLEPAAGQTASSSARDEDYPAALLEIFDRATKARLRSSRGIASST